MSENEARQFIQAVQGSRELQRRVSALRGAGVMKRLAAIAAEVGYVFTPAEYRAAVADAAEGQLSDQSLDELARSWRFF